MKIFVAQYLEKPRNVICNYNNFKVVQCTTKCTLLHAMNLESNNYLKSNSNNHLSAHCVNDTCLKPDLH